MKASEVREEYLKFFEKRGHKIISPAPLVLKDDPTTLFTSAGMQPLVPNLLGKKHPDGDRLVDSQPCFRSQDIEEVGDNRHDTLFEMLGNWGLGSYFKKEQIPWIWEFLTKDLGLPKEKLYVTVFEGNDQLNKDIETLEIWKFLGVNEDHIYFYGDKKNWWSRAGAPSNMPAGEPGGPSSEVFYKFEQVEHNKKYGEKCHPNCDCGKYIEIANSVFVQYKKESNGTLSELKQKNVDFGGGLERILMAVNDQPDMFKNDLHYPIIQKTCELLNISYEKSDQTKSNLQVIADHIKASVFLIADGVVPMNKLQGYVLRRLLRRAAVKAESLGLNPVESFKDIVQITLNIYEDVNYFREKKDMGSIEYIYDQVIDPELRKFSLTLKKGLKEFEKFEDSQFNVLNAFNLYQSYGFPFEVTQELFKEKGKEIDKIKFNELVHEHQELSRKSSEKKFAIK